jgi:hypothetical protein
MESKFTELLNNKRFIKKILNMEKGTDVREAFERRGIELDKIKFSRLCQALVENFKNKNKKGTTKEITVVSEHASVDYEIGDAKNFTPTKHIAI